MPSDFSLIRALGLLAVFALLIDSATRKTLLLNSVARTHSVFVVCSIYFLMSVVSISYSENPEAGVLLLGNILSLIFLVIVVVMSIKTVSDFENFICIICAGYLVSTSLALLMTGSLISLDPNVVSELRLDRGRFSGLLRNPNRYAYYGLLVYWGGFILFGILERKRKYGVLFMCLGSIAVLLTLSRAVIIGLGVGWVVLILFSPRKYARICGAVLVVMAVLSILLFQEYELVLRHRFSHQTLAESSSSIARLYLWRYAIGVILENPFLGIGLGSLDGVIRPWGFHVHDPHNVLLYMYLYYGVPGVFLFIGVLVSVLVRSMHAARRFNPRLRRFGFFFLSSMLIPGLFHTVIFWKPFVISLCVLFILSGDKIFRQSVNVR